MGISEKITYSLLAVSILVGGFIVYQSQKEESKTETHINTVRTQPTTTTDTSLNLNTSPQKKNELSYEDALDTYKGKHFQFANCRAHPSFFTIKNGSEILLDNRSSEPSSIAVGGERYVLDAFSFVVIQVSDPVLPKTIQIDCEISGTQQFNTAQIELQQ